MATPTTWCGWAALAGCVCALSLTPCPHRLQDPKTGEATWEAPEAASWKEAESTDPAHKSRAYFYNSRTKETVWERPADSNVAWQKSHDEI